MCHKSSYSNSKCCSKFLKIFNLVLLLMLTALSMHLYLIRPGRITVCTKTDQMNQTIQIINQRQTNFILDEIAWYSLLTCTILGSLINLLFLCETYCSSNNIIREHDDLYRNELINTISCTAV